MLHVGPMISSRKITCIGVKMLGNFQPRNSGSDTVRMIGMWMEMMYCIAFFRLP